jgi:hypothetical protein
MPDPDAPDAPPPEVPEEFAAAYREAYRRSFEADRSAPPPEHLVAAGPHHAVEPSRRMPRYLERWRTSPWFVPGVCAAVALILVLGAYVTGRVLPDSANAPGSGRAKDSSGAHPGSPSRPASSARPTVPGSWAGALTSVSIGAVSAACTAPPAQDAAGHPVSYVPDNAIDGNPGTAWRCPGTAVGQKLTFRLASAVDVAEVGLIPGYAKTDPSSGVDRYAENNRITKVRWTLADGVSFVQRLDGDPHRRAVQLLRVPRTRTDTVVVEILAVRRGARNDTAISEVVIAAAPGR